jgi:protein-S-isoprenylcysteine O-methyltransferase Ste14
MAQSIAKYNRKIFLIPPYYFLFSITLILILYLSLPSVTSISFPYNLFGIIGIVAGMYLIMQSYEHFKQNSTTVKFNKSNKIVSEGLYRYSRNPMYLGNVVFLTGMSILTGMVITLLIPALFFIIIDRMFIPYEEEKMGIEIGEAYLNYKKKVRRWV